MSRTKYTEEYIKQICDEKDLIFVDIDMLTSRNFRPKNLALQIIIPDYL